MFEEDFNVSRIFWISDAALASLPEDRGFLKNPESYHHGVFVSGNKMLIATVNATVFVWDFKWNSVQKFKSMDLMQEYPFMKLQLKKMAEYDDVEFEDEGQVLHALILAITRQVSADEFTKGMHGLFECPLAHKVHHNFLTGEYVFQAKDEVYVDEDGIEWATYSSLNSFITTLIDVMRNRT